MVFCFRFWKYFDIVFIVEEYKLFYLAFFNIFARNKTAKWYQKPVNMPSGQCFL
jgi:hypothetical protein